MLDLATRVVLPEDLFGFCVTAGCESGRVQNFALNNVFLDVQVYSELTKLLRGLDILQKFLDPLEAISRVADLVVLKRLHLSAVRSEVIGQRRFVAELSRQVDPSVQLVYIKEGLVWILQPHVVYGCEVLDHSHGLILFSTLAFHHKAVGARRKFSVQAVNLVRPDLIRSVPSDDSDAGRI